VGRSCIGSSFAYWLGFESPSDRLHRKLVLFVQFFFELNNAIHLSLFCLLFEMTGSETYP